MVARRLALPLLSALVLTACQGAPAGGGAGVGVPAGMPVMVQEPAGGERYRILAIEELPAVAITTDGDAPGFPKARMDDGDLATQWSSATYRGATAWAAVQLATAATIAAIRVKTGPTPAGTAYDVQISDDGTTWRTGLAGVTTTGWSLERKALPANTRGRFVRLFWRNNAANPQPRFSIYELAVDGEAGTAPVPTTAPTATPVPASPQPTTAPPSGPVAKLRIAAAAASSSYDGLLPGRASDGDPGTQWANGGYKASEASWTADLGAAVAVDHLRVKTGFLPAGVTYDLGHSTDGTTWTQAASGLNNGGWGLVQRPLAARARYVRLRFHNDPGAPIARMPLYELEAWGRAAAAATTRGLRIAGATHRVRFGPSVSIGGTRQAVIAVAQSGTRAEAMIAVDRGRYGWTYGRITPENAHLWSGDLGSPGAVSFLGADNGTGAWTFTHRDMDGAIYPVEATTAAHTTPWRLDRAASVDLGSAPRKWRAAATELGGPAYERPGAFVAFKRPDGVWDFAQLTGSARPELAYPGSEGAGSPLFEAVGRVYAFFLTTGAEDPCPDVDVTFTALD